jgi:hypothetical protein
VGKETDRRWEQGEDLSLVEFKAVEYEGSKQVVASDEIKPPPAARPRQMSEMAIFAN